MAFKSFQSDACLSSWRLMHSPFPHTMYPSARKVLLFLEHSIFFLDWFCTRYDMFEMPFFYLCLTFCKIRLQNHLFVCPPFSLSASLSIIFMYSVCYGIIKIIMWFPEFDPFMSLPQKRFSKSMNHFCGGSHVWFNNFEMDVRACIYINYHTT